MFGSIKYGLPIKAFFNGELFYDLLDDPFLRIKEHLKSAMKCGHLVELCKNYCIYQTRMETPCDGYAMKRVKENEPLIKYFMSILMSMIHLMSILNEYFMPIYIYVYIYMYIYFNVYICIYLY